MPFTTEDLRKAIDGSDSSKVYEIIAEKDKTVAADYEAALEFVYTWERDKLLKIKAEEQRDILHSWRFLDEKREEGCDAYSFHHGIRDEMRCQLNKEFGKSLTSNHIDGIVGDELYNQIKRPVVHVKLDGLINRIDALLCSKDAPPGTAELQEIIKRRAITVFTFSRTYDQDYQWLHAHFENYKTARELLHSLKNCTEEKGLPEIDKIKKEQANVIKESILDAFRIPEASQASETFNLIEKEIESLGYLNNSTKSEEKFPISMRAARSEAIAALKIYPEMITLQELDKKVMEMLLLPDEDCQIELKTALCLYLENVYRTKDLKIARANLNIIEKRIWPAIKNAYKAIKESTDHALRFNVNIPEEKKAKAAADILNNGLMVALVTLLKNGQFDKGTLGDFTTKTDNIIKAGEATLSKHRGWKRLLGNLLIAFTVIGLLFLGGKAIYSYWKKRKITLFFNDTTSIKKITAIKAAFQEIPVIDMEKSAPDVQAAKPG